MKNLRNRVLSVTLRASLSASLAATAATAARADSDNPISTGATAVLGSTLLIGQMTGNAVTSSADSATGSSAGTTRATGASEAEKRTIAANAIEDAAQYYATGELAGVLPAAIARVRELVPEAASMDDAALVDVIVAAADRILEAPRP